MRAYKVISHLVDRWGITVTPINICESRYNPYESDAHRVIKKQQQQRSLAFKILNNNNLNILWSGCYIFTNIRQQSWMQPFITLAQLFPSSWIPSTLSQANEKDTDSKLIMIGQLFHWGLSRINNRFLDIHWQPLLGLGTALQTLPHYQHISIWHAAPDCYNFTHRAGS